MKSLGQIDVPEWGVYFRLQSTPHGMDLVCRDTKGEVHIGWDSQLGFAANGTHIEYAAQIIPDLNQYAMPDPAPALTQRGINILAMYRADIFTLEEAGEALDSMRIQLGLKPLGIDHWRTRLARE